MPERARKILTNPIHCLAFGFGSGLAPVAPGTFGTLLAVPLYLLFADMPLAVYGFIVVIACVGGICLCDKAASDLGVHDHPGIVWDEFVGLWIALFALPAGWLWIVIGFALFRLFDIWKPWPIDRLDNSIKGGLGIMLDDVVAGIYALVCVQILATVL